jgi:hypothetical protein
MLRQHHSFKNLFFTFLEIDCSRVRGSRLVVVIAEERFTQFFKLFFTLNCSPGKKSKQSRPMLLEQLDSLIFNNMCPEENSKNQHL